MRILITGVHPFMQGRLGGACSLTGSFADSENAN